MGYQRLRGKRCLFPFGLHCTGMPIKVSMKVFIDALVFTHNWFWVQNGWTNGNLKYMFSCFYCCPKIAKDI